MTAGSMSHTLPADQSCRQQTRAAEGKGWLAPDGHLSFQHTFTVYSLLDSILLDNKGRWLIVPADRGCTVISEDHVGGNTT